MARLVVYLKGTGYIFGVFFFCFFFLFFFFFCFVLFLFCFFCHFLKGDIFVASCLLSCTSVPFC